MPFDLILWLLVYYNSLAAQGYRYNVSTARFDPPAAVKVDRVESQTRRMASR